MTLLPLSDHIIVSPVREQYYGNLVRLDKDLDAEGIVVAVGPGKRGKNGQRIPLDVSVGDRVLCNRQSADPIRHDGKEYKVVSIRDVLCVL